jgi:hypothetical protein
LNGTSKEIRCRFVFRFAVDGGLIGHGYTLIFTVTTISFGERSRLRPIVSPNAIHAVAVAFPRAMVQSIVLVRSLTPEYIPAMET